MKIICNYCGGRTGEICVLSGQNYFPFADWDDFCVEIISWWIHILICESQNSSFDFPFMDGLYELHFQKDTKGILVSGVDGWKDDGTIVFQEMTSLSAIQAELITVAHAILSCPCTDEKMKDELVRLADNLRRLEKDILKE